MGGYGSGPRNYSPDTSQARKLDIRYLRKSNQLSPGHSGGLVWSSRGQLTGATAVLVHKDMGAITLEYLCLSSAGEPQSKPLTIQLCSLPCNYGGERFYFRCPNMNCNRRCEVLYAFAGGFMCRQCCRLLYPSQKGSTFDKLCEARFKLGSKIFEDWNGHTGYQKRKGMHWRTFTREFRRYQALYGRSLSTIEEILEDIKGDK